MAAVNFELRSYQTDALNTLGDYLTKVPHMSAGTAFYDIALTPYFTAPMVKRETPYVCIRIPTGGGKTIVASHSVGVAAKSYLQVDNPMVLWLVPSTAILEQTLAALRNLEHPYRAALAEDFGRNLSVMTVSEALSLSRADASGGACIIVSTIQAFKIEDTAGRKVYQDAGALMDHFSGLTKSQIDRLELIENSNRPVASLANLLRLHRPMVIVDEAHNARGPLSFETLARFDPSLILELTATPRLERDEKTGNEPSNVLYHVSAAELKAAEMIKLPIRLQTDTDWKKVIGQALDCRTALEEAAQAESSETGEYIRPIILFQAQSKSKTDPDKLVPEAVAKFLVDDKRISRDQIAIHGGGKKELDDLDDIGDPECPIRFVITIQALREGWDCPFAYVLCSVGELKSATAVEQILGRILRMPKTRRKTRDELNRAYAFVASSNFNATATSLKDGLVDGAGFDRLEAEDLVKSNAGLEFAEDKSDFIHQSDELPESPSATTEAVESAIGKLPSNIKARIDFDGSTRKLNVRGAISRDQRNSMLLAFSKIEGAEKIIDRVFIKSNRIQATEDSGDEKPPFVLPRLCILRQGELELFARDHFLDLPWNLAEYDVSGFVDRYSIKDSTKAGLIDVSEEGKMKIDYIGDLHAQLSMVIHEPAWTLPRLVNWIDRGIPHPDVTKPSAKIFIQNALERLIDQKGYSLDELARYKAEIKRSLADEIQKLRSLRENECYNSFFSDDAQTFKTDSNAALVFDEQSYAYNQPYRGSRKFKKHYFEIIGDLKPQGEEFECAVFLDEHPRVRYWIRNVDRKPNSFWLQLPSRKFYPDFVVLLTDGRFLAVEYKGAHLIEESKAKLAIGNLWAETSEGKCLFAMPTDRNFVAIDELMSS